MRIDDWELETLRGKYEKWKFERVRGELVATRPGFQDVRSRTKAELEAKMGAEVARLQVAASKTRVPWLDS
jgi:hypothetical protein